MQVAAYWPPKGDISGSSSPKETLDLPEPQTPTDPATPTPLPDRLHLALVGKDDGSLQAKLPQTIKQGRRCNSQDDGCL